MIRNNRGVILLTTLSVMAVIAMLSTALLDDVMLFKYASYNNLNKQLSYVAAASALAIAERNVVTRIPNCIYDEPGDLGQKPDAWWHDARRCRGILRGWHYYYVITDVGYDACAVLRGKKQAGVLFSKISLMVMKHHVRKLVATVVAVPDASQEVCDGKTHVITPGRQSWLKLL